MTFALPGLAYCALQYSDNRRHTQASVLELMVKSRLTGNRLFAPQ
jgi:hypothetical protein